MEGGLYVVATDYFVVNDGVGLLAHHSSLCSCVLQLGYCLLEGISLLYKLGQCHFLA